MKFETIPALLNLLQSTELFKTYHLDQGWYSFPLKGGTEDKQIFLFFDVSRFYYNRGEVKFLWMDRQQGLADCRLYDFQEVLEAAIPEVQEIMVFHLDLFR